MWLQRWPEGQVLAVSRRNITVSKLQTGGLEWAVGVMLVSEPRATRVGQGQQGRKGRAVG